VPDTATEKSRLGWIGTGRMGFELARRLLSAGHDVAVCNRTRAKAERLTEFGATVVDRPDELADRDAVFTSVPSSPDLLAVTVEGGGVLVAAGAVPGILVDCSTVSSEASATVRQQAAERGSDFLAAPVSGNPQVVRSGELTLAVSGSARAFGEAEPLLRILGRGVTYVGEGEAARLVKLCHNLFLGVVIQSLVEVTSLAERGGTSRAAFLEFLNNSVLGSRFTRYKTPALVHLDFAPTFTTELLRKDFDIGLAAARDLEVPLSIASHAASIVASAIGAGHRDEDFAALIVEQARAAGMTLTPEDAAVDDGLRGSSAGD
jgi:3-hydroxyisobutyrate dehydrogenase-like beta-hydroxyacid dehydrogenase